MNYQEGSQISTDDYQKFVQSITDYLKMEENKHFLEPAYKISHPASESNIPSNDNVSFLEYLIYQYSQFASVKDFCSQLLKSQVSFDEIQAAQKSFEEINKAIKEEKKDEELSAIFDQAQKNIENVQDNFGKGITSDTPPEGETFLFSGTLWWMDKDFETKKAQYITQPS